MQPIGGEKFGITFPLFQNMIQEYREALQRQAHKMERNIATQYSVANDIALVKLHGELASLHTAFQKCVVHQEFATWDEVVECFWALGIMPRQKNLRNEGLEKLARDKCGAHTGGYSFVTYLDLVMHMRDINQTSYKQIVQNIFILYDRDRSGSLDKSELIKVFSSMGVSPRTQEDQNRLLALIETQYDDGVDAISMSEFAALYGRAKEVFQSGEYATDQTLAKQFGFNMHQVRRFRESYMEIEHNDAGGIDILGLRTLLKSLKLYMSAESLKTHFTQLDTDESGYLEFGEFLKLMHQLNTDRGGCDTFAHTTAPLRTLSSFDSLQLWKTAEALNMGKEVRNMTETDLMEEIAQKLTNIGLDPEGDFAKMFQLNDHDDFIAVIQTTLATLSTTPRRPRHIVARRSSENQVEDCE